MKEYARKQLQNILEQDGDDHRLKLVKILLDDIQKTVEIKECNAIQIDTLQKIVKDESSKRNDLFTSTIDKTRSKNLAYLDVLEKNLVDLNSEIDEISDIADSIQRDNKELIITQTAKSKLQEALVQLLNDTMAEKAAAQITVNETKLTTNDRKVKKNSFKNIYADYEVFHADRVQKVKTDIK